MGEGGGMWGEGGVGCGEREGRDVGTGREGDVGRGRERGCGEREGRDVGTGREGMWGEGGRGEGMWGEGGRGGMWRKGGRGDVGSEEAHQIIQLLTSRTFSGDL